jgi:hypothetical protein
MWPFSVPAQELPCVHVLDHAMTQRGDGIRTHGKLLSWMRLTTTSILKTGRLVFLRSRAAKGVAEMARVVKPGGTVATYAWDMEGFPSSIARSAENGLDTNPYVKTFPVSTVCQRTI